MTALVSKKTPLATRTGSVKMAVVVLIQDVTQSQVGDVKNLALETGIAQVVVVNTTNAKQRKLNVIHVIGTGIAPVVVVSTINAKILMRPVLKLMFMIRQFHGRRLLEVNNQALFTLSMLKFKNEV